MVAPLWSVSWNGPPIATGVATPRTPPSTQNMRRSPITRLAPKADAITSGRAIRSILIFPPARSEAASNAGHDRLEKHRSPIAEPHRERGDDDDEAAHKACDRNRAPNLAGRQGCWQLVGAGKRQGHDEEIGPQAASD